MPPPSPLLYVLAGGIVVGLIFWVATASQKPQKKRKVKSSPKAGLVDRIYDPKSRSEQTIRSPLAPDFPQEREPSLYSVDNYRGPMGVPVPYGTIKEEYLPIGALRTMPRPGSLPARLDPYVPEGRFPLGLSGFVTSVDVPFAVGREVSTEWSKVGLLIKLGEGPEVGDKDPKIMDLYGRPIAPLQDLFQYRAQDKNGFTIPLTYQKRELEDGDIVNEIPGKPGKWKASLDTNRFIWM